jgi:hypothetical protein
MGFRVVATLSHDWVKIAELAGADPFLNIWHPGTSELEVESVDQATLDTAFATYTGDQANIDAATTAAKETVSRDADKVLYDDRRLWRAVAELMIDELNVLRALHTLPDRTVAQARAAIRNKIDNL